MRTVWRGQGGPECECERRGREGGLGGDIKSVSGAEDFVKFACKADAGLGEAFLQGGEIMVSVVPAEFRRGFDIEVVTGFLWAEVVDLGPQGLGFLGPSHVGIALPSGDFFGGRVVELFGEFGVGQVHGVDESFVPEAVEVYFFVEPFDEDPISAAVFFASDVEGLMDVSHEVDVEGESVSFFGFGCGGIAKDSFEVGEFGEDIAFDGGFVFAEEGVVGDGHVVPRFGAFPIGV